MAPEDKTSGVALLSLESHCCNYCFTTVTVTSFLRLFCLEELRSSPR